MSQVWRLVMGHATEELNTGSKEWAEDLVDDFDDMDARANVLQHMNQLVRFKGGLVKFLQCLVRSLEVHGVDSSASVADATAAVCAEDVRVKACFERGEKTPYMQATQQAVLHVARQLKASSRAVSEGNALCTVWDTFVSFLKDKGLSPEDDAADWSLHHMHEADGVCEELGGSYWCFAALHVVRRATVLRHLFRPVSDCGGIRSFVREVLRDMELLEAADEQGFLKNAAPAQWVRALTASASFQAGDDVCMAECPRQTPSEQRGLAWDALEGAMDETDLDEDRLSRGSVSTPLLVAADVGDSGVRLEEAGVSVKSCSPTNQAETQTADTGLVCPDVFVSSSPHDEDDDVASLAPPDVSPPRSFSGSLSPGRVSMPCDSPPPAPSLSSRLRICRQTMIPVRREFRRFHALLRDMYVLGGLSVVVVVGWPVPGKAFLLQAVVRRRCLATVREDCRARSHKIGHACSRTCHFCF